MKKLRLITATAAACWLAGCPGPTAMPAPGTPPLMTTIAMGAGMLPIAIGFGAADPSFRSPMSIAAIGGLITSTVLSLLVVPVVFTSMHDLEQWTGRTRSRLRRATGGARAKPVPAAPADEKGSAV